MARRCGYIALMGRPNAGKSTLLNALVGDKLAVVSRKPQTTRNRILGIALEGETQFLFLDTPGMHRARKNLINSTMNRVAMTAATEADLLLYLVDVEAGFREEDEIYLERVIESTKAQCLILLTKVDAVKKDVVADVLAETHAAIASFLEKHPEAAERIMAQSPMPISAKRPESLVTLKEFAATWMPDSPWLFADDDLTDMPRNFVVSELIREQAFRQLSQEIPYGIAVKIGNMEFKPDMVVVYATLVLTRASHKPIVLGKGGARIKSLGTEARTSLEQHFGKRVYLDLSVSVAEGWIDDQRLIAELAHMSDEHLSSFNSDEAH